MEILADIMGLLREQGMDDVMVVLGGIIPEQDRQPLADMGVTAVFGPGASTYDIVEFIRSGVHGAAAGH